MNRTIALLIPAILLAAMALIVFQQFYSSSDETLTPQSVNAEAPAPQANNPVSPGYQEQAAQNSGESNLPGISAPEQSAPVTMGQQTSTLQAQTQPTSPLPVQSGQTQAQTVQERQSAAGQSSAATTETATTPNTESNRSDKPEQTEQPTAPSPEKDKPASASTSGKTHKAESFKFQYQGSDMLFIINADSDFEYKSFVLNSPDRLIIDLLGNWSGVENIKAPSNRLISGMRNGKTERGHRVVLDLKEAPKGYDTKREGSKLTVRVF